MQPLDDMTFDHMITKLRMLYYNFHKVQSPNLVGIHDTIALCHVIYVTCFMSFLYVMWSRNLLTLLSPNSIKTITTKLGSVTYKSVGVAYLHMTWINHAKAIKGTAPKAALMNGTNLNRPRDFWLYDTLTNEKSICNSYKRC